MGSHDQHRVIEPADSSKACPLSLLPTELLERVISHLPLIDRCSVSATCYALCKVARSIHAGSITVRIPDVDRVKEADGTLSESSACALSLFLHTWANAIAKVTVHMADFECTNGPAGVCQSATFALATLSLPNLTSLSVTCGMSSPLYVEELKALLRPVFISEEHS